MSICQRAPDGVHLAILYSSTLVPGYLLSQDPVDALCNATPELSSSGNSWEYPEDVWKFREVLEFRSNAMMVLSLAISPKNLLYSLSMYKA